MSDVLEQMEKFSKNTYAAADILDSSKLIESEDFEGSYDPPHIWFDVQLWIEIVKGIEEKNN